MTIKRAVPNLRSDRLAESRDFFVELFGFEVAMDLDYLDWFVKVVSPLDHEIQVNIVGRDDPAAPGISIDVPDVDAVYAAALERGEEIVYSLRDESWGIRRFALREPGSGTIVAVVSRLPR